MDLNYGDDRLLKQMVSEIKSFPKITSSNKNALIKFVDLIVGGYRDLKLFKVGDELSNFNVMGIIESNLPTETRYGVVQKAAIKGISGKERKV